MKNVDIPNNNGMPVMLQLLTCYVSIMAFWISSITADGFRAWSSWSFGFISSIVVIVVNWSKIRTETKKIFKKRK